MGFMGSFLLKHMGAPVALLFLLLPACAEKPVQTTSEFAVPAISAGAEPPRITLLAPTGEGLLDVGTLTVAGVVSRPASKITVTAGDVSTPARTWPDGRFVASFPVPAGDLKIFVRALLKDGQTAERELSVRNIPADRAILADISDEPILTGNAMQELRGTVAEGVRALVLNGDPVPMDGSRFSRTVVLPGDGPQTIRLEALTTSGLTYEKNAVFILDRTPPFLTVSGLPGRTNQAEVMVSIEASEPLERVELIGQTISPVENGRYQSAISLIPGRNEITILAADPAGNITRLDWTTVRDSEPPAFSCQPSGPVKNDPVEVVCTANEPLLGAVIGKSPAVIRDGHTAAVLLAGITEGEQSIPVRLADLAGNEATGVARFTIDRIAPALTILEPANGRTPLPSFRITGTVEPGSTVRIGGNPVQSLLGLFSADFVRAEGRHDFEITADDAAGNRASLRQKIDVRDDPKRFLRATGETRGKATSDSPLSATLAQPLEGRAYGAEVPISLNGLRGKSLSVLLNGEPLLTEAMLPAPSGNPANAQALADILPSAKLHEGGNHLAITVTSATGHQMQITRNFTVDRQPPQVAIINPLDGELVQSVTPVASVNDVSSFRTEWTLDGKPLAAEKPVAVRAHGRGSRVLCLRAVDAAGNIASTCRTVILHDAPPLGRRGSTDPRPAATAPIRRDLIQPMLADLVATGLLADILLGNLTLLGDAAGTFYPDLSGDLDELAQVLVEQARSGELAAVLRSLTVFRKRGWWEDAEALLAGLTRPPSGPADKTLRGRRVPLADATFALDGFLPQSAVQFAALDRLVAVDLGRGRTALDLPSAAIEILTRLDSAAWSGLWTQTRAGTEGELASAFDRLGQVMAKPEPDGVTPFDRLEPVYRNLLGTGRDAPLGLLFDTYLEAVAKLPDTRDRETFRLLAGVLLEVLLDPRTARAFGRILDTPYLEANAEWLRETIDRGDLIHLLRVLSKASLESDPRNPTAPVLAATVRLLQMLWETDRRNRSRTYAESMAIAIGELLQAGSDGTSSIADFVNYLGTISDNDRQQLGRIFWQSSKKNERPADPFPANGPTDAERLMRLFAVANSPLNCGAPIPFTSQVVPLNVPGLPQLFPTDNFITELFEASTYFKPDTVIQLARLMPKFIHVLRTGDNFCEPEIVKELLSDTDVIEASIAHPLLPDLLRLGRQMVLRRQHHAAIRLLTIFSDSGVVPHGIPLLATLYKTDGAEQLYQFVERQKSWELRNRNQLTAFEHSLRSGAVLLAPDRDHVVPGAELAGRLHPFFRKDRLIHLERAFSHVGRRLVSGEQAPGLGRMDLVASRWIAADPDGHGIRQLRDFLDGSPENGDLVAVLAALPPASGQPSVIAASLPGLAVNMDEAGLVDAGLNLGRRFFTINRQTGASLSWTFHKLFYPRPDTGQTPFSHTMPAFSALSGHMTPRQAVWKAWAGSGTARPLEPLLKSVRHWTRARESGPPHALRVRTLLTRLTRLPAPEGRGLLVDRAAELAGKSRENGFARTLIETLEMLEVRGYLDTRNPSIMDWAASRLHNRDLDDGL